MRQSVSSRLVNKLPMAEAAAKLILAGINNSYEFRQMKVRAGKFKNITRPHDVPGDPHEHYADFSTWSDFFQKGQEYLDAGNFPPEIPTYEELKRRMLECGIDTKQKFFSFVKKHNEEPLPRAPDRYYGGRWESWDKFLAPNQNFMPYAKAKEVLAPYCLRSSTAFREMCRVGARPRGIPAMPHRDYAEFAGWDDFLSYK